MHPKAISSKRVTSSVRVVTIVKVINPARVVTSSVKVVINPAISNAKEAISPVTSNVTNNRRPRANKIPMPRVMP